MGGIVDFVFGGRASRAQRETIDQNERSAQFTREQNALARDAAFDLFPIADVNRNAAAQQALNLLGGIPQQQANLLRHGFNASQNAALAGSQQFENAILGLPVNRAALRTQAPTPDFSRFEGVTLPEFQVGGQVEAARERAANQAARNDQLAFLLNNGLGGRGGFTSF